MSVCFHWSSWRAEREFSVWNPYAHTHTFPALEQSRGFASDNLLNRQSHLLYVAIRWVCRNETVGRILPSLSSSLYQFSPSYFWLFLCIQSSATLTEILTESVHCCPVWTSIASQPSLWCQAFQPTFNYLYSKQAKTTSAFRCHWTKHSSN